MILEGIVTTRNADGSPNISPMGPEVEADFARLVLKPFQTSATYANLKRTGQGVFHVVDDVELLACAAIDRFDPLPRLIPADGIDGEILADACRWYAFRVTALDDREQRSRIDCQVVGMGRLRDFFGWNRAKHAVVEAAILATRAAWLPPDHLRSDLARLQPLVDKTGGESERRAFERLRAYVEDQLRTRPVL